MLDDRLDNIFLECWTPADMVLLDHWERQGSMEHSEQGGDIVLHGDDTEYCQDNGVPAPDLLTPARTVSSCWLLLTVLSGDVICLTSPSLLWLLCNSVSNIICINSYHTHTPSNNYFLWILEKNPSLSVWTSSQWLRWYTCSWNTLTLM